MTTLSEEILHRFAQWYAEAKAHPHIQDASAMTLATSGITGQPTARMVLLKEFNERGLTFYTNYHSRKSLDLLENPYAALCFHWAPLGKQLRIEGSVEKTSEAESDVYFNSRPLESKWGAWASEQSHALESREVMLERYEKVKQHFGEHVPRPAHWGGWRVVPIRVEFWSHGDHRLHLRDAYSLHAGAWALEKLFP